jgi:DtxR family Mn-dependent transcriptional regulator
MRSSSEEDYLKAIYSLSIKGDTISTNDIARSLSMKASSVTDMLKKLADKKWVNYIKYKGVSLSKEGEMIALLIIRKHRLWETFLVNQLNFKWDQVHEIAEQLEHIDSIELINRLDKHLGFPKFDPHGDPIPNEKGEIKDLRKSQPLSSLRKGDRGIIIGVIDGTPVFLRYLDNEGLNLGTEILVEDIYDFDSSYKLKIKGKNLTVSDRVSQNLLIQF